MSEALARHYVGEAEDRLDSARRALGRGRHSTSVFYAQECVEFAVKAAMEALSIKYPPIHDVSGLVLRLEKDERLPDWFRKQAPRMAGVVSGLADQRIPARYGDQIRKRPPSELFDKGEAKKAIADAGEVYGLSRRFVDWWFKARK